MNSNLVVNVYKPISKTPLEVVNDFKKKFPQYAHSTISYAGRLDPMAHGVLILLIDDENKNRREYENMQKIYKFKILVGFSTDTYDILGIPSKRYEESERINKDDFKEHITKYIGKQTQQLPPFSSYIVNHKPLFWWARENRLNEIVIPRKEIDIDDIELLNIATYDSKTILNVISNRINNCKGNFRQPAILNKWNELLNIKKEIQIIEMTATVSAGSYIRGLVNSISSDLKVDMCCIEIFRTKAGEYDIQKSTNMYERINKDIINMYNHIDE